MKRKYESWGEFLKKRREARYRSAREFCSKVNVGISYPQYSRYEAGDQLPNLEQALELCRLLDVPVLEGLLEWNRAQIADSAVKKDVDTLLDNIRTRGLEGALSAGKPAAAAPAVPVIEAQKVAGVGVFTHATVSLDDVIVFNRSHLRLFLSDPMYRDIFTYVNSYAPEWIAFSEVAAALGQANEKIEEMIDKLSDLGVVLTAGGKCRASKRNFYFPDDSDFFPLRNLNLTHNATSLMKKLSHEDLMQRRAYRSLVTRELTNDQLDKVITRLDELVSSVVGMPETNNPERIYSLCVLMGERFTRPRLDGSQPHTGLRVGKSAETVASAGDIVIG